MGEDTKRCDSNPKSSSASTPNLRSILKTKPQPGNSNDRDHRDNVKESKSDNHTPARPAPTTPQQDSTPDFEEPLPGYQHRITNYPGGYSHSTLPVAHTPFGLQQPYAQPYPGFVPQVQAPAHIFSMEGRSEYTTPNQEPGAQNYTENPVPSMAQGPMEHQWHPRFDEQYSQQAFMPMPMPMPAHPAAISFQMQTGYVGQPMPMPGMAFQGQPQPQQPGPPQYVMQPGQAQPQPGPPPHITGQPTQFVNGQPGQYVPYQFPPQAPQQFSPQPAQAQFPGPPGGFQQVGQGQVTAGQPMPGGVSTLPPDIMGIGRTRSEFAAEQATAAVSNEANEPQDFQPADPNPGRMYWVRQLDNEWVQMSRATVDNLACRWYVWPSGVFYAVRLED
ncbi:hypothetical protein MGN70_011699 [Eutypa lata]|nr:hypothetical protein MGN70_011699 [Eutypa lata]